MLDAGVAAPGFRLPDQRGATVDLADLRGGWVLLWWYPRAATPGWTLQGQGLRDRSSELRAAGVTVLGASFDSVEANRAFDDAQGFGFRLLSDTARSVGAAYGVLREADEAYAAMPQRVAYVIDPGGRIARAYRVSDVAGFADLVLADLRDLAG